ncbi:DUF3854 domain-containing protein [Limnoraphis robusta Tam1]|uniref:DUF3854 domain-containing protein n=1 Tax=Limnoraphis robusta TaxID=1118279 RepID=UPI002B1F3333|nr:DUF3854 domain-containing protein [Limnoraphis robusta]MEA5496199.1 DUF3854 domain-containing protein [Limnoraphis robusta BA-68 BA1]MEA5538501.1 DUF3854 domain-containing protein [Limnoraphis robusta Tam1]
MVASFTRRLEVNSLARFNTKHLADWIDESGVSEEITKLNIESLTREEVNERIKPKHPIKTGGWWCRGVNWRNGQPMGNRYGQVKPDEKHFDPNKPDDKGAKYLTASGMEPDAIFLAMPDPDYWQKVYEDKSIPIIWTEGAKKAGAGLTHGFATIALTGVYNWGKDYQLAPFVKLFIERGGEQYVAFDSDYREKPQCREAIRRFCNLARMAGIDLKIITWDSRYKGMDDFLKEKGKGAFEYQKFSAEKLKNWEKQLNKDLGSQNRPPTPTEIAHELSEKCRPEWKYHHEQSTWRHWNGKCWESVNQKVFEKFVKDSIDGKGIKYPRPSYFKDVAELMMYDLMVPRWETLERYKFIPFDNGVLEINSGKLREHNPKDGLTQVLPRIYKPVKVDNLLESLQNNCPLTHRYLMTSLQGNNPMIKKFLAAINGVITGKFSQHQMFLQLTGKPRGGKGVGVRLLKKCVGESNCGSADLDKLDRLVTRAKIIDKVLAEIPEGRSISEGAISTLLALTGGDSVDCERKYQDPFSQKFNGTIVITSNRQIGTAKYPELTERLCLIPFNYTIPTEKRISNLDQLIEPEIPQLIAIALSMSDTEVVQLLKGIDEGYNAAVKLHQWELKTEESVVAAYLNDELIVESGEFVTTSKLHERFKSYCSDQGKQPLSLKRFARELNELCEHLDLGVNWNKVTRHSQFEGLRLREDWDTLPTYEQTLRQSSAPIEKVQSPIDTLINAPIETQTQKDFAPIAPIESNLSSIDVQQISENLPELPKQSEKQIIPKPPLAKYTLDQKKKWLKKNKDNKPTVWVNHPMYTGEAILDGRYDIDGNPWRVTYGDRYLNVKPEDIEIFKALCGDIQPISDPPEGIQTALSFDVNQSPKPETPIQRVKRLAKQQGFKLTPDDFSFSRILERYQKSELQELTGEELTEIADQLQKQIDGAKRRQEDNRITKYLEE